jgi:hypothetical protein
MQPLHTGVKLRLVNDVWLARAYLLSTRDPRARSFGVLPTVLFYDKTWNNDFVRQCVRLNFCETVDVVLASRHIWSNLDQDTWVALCHGRVDTSSYVLISWGRFELRSKPDAGLDTTPYLSAPPASFELLGMPDTPRVSSIWLNHGRTNTQVQCRNRNDLLVHLHTLSEYTQAGGRLLIHINIPQHLHGIRTCFVVNAIMDKPGPEDALPLARHRIVYRVV